MFTDRTIPSRFLISMFSPSLELYFLEIRQNNMFYDDRLKSYESHFKFFFLQKGTRWFDRNDISDVALVFRYQTSYFEPATELILLSLKQYRYCSFIKIHTTMTWRKCNDCKKMDFVFSFLSCLHVHCNLSPIFIFLRNTNY